MKFAKRVFLIAGIYGVLALLPQYFMEKSIGRDFPPPITHPEHFYGFIGVALAWQIFFFMISRDPVRYRPAMVPSALEKLGFGVADVVLYAQGRAPVVPVLAAGIVDLIFVALFVLAIRSTPRSTTG